MISKFINNIISNLKANKNSIALKYPDEQILITSFCKGLKTDSNLEIGRNTAWIMAKRGKLILSENRIFFKSWDIPIDSIKIAEYFEYQGHSQIIRIETKNGEYFQFGMMKNHEWLNQKKITSQNTI